MNLEKELLGFMSEWKHWTSQEIFIDSFRNFLSLVSKEKEISIVLLSFPVENKDYSKTVRILYENKISDKKIQKFSQLKLSEVNKNNIINKDNYSIFSLGKRKDQEIICAVDDLSSFFDASILEILLKYMRGGFQYLNQLVDKSVLLSLAYTDDVTGFYNQRKLGKDLSRLIEQFKRFQNNFSVLFIDIDHFKNVNDSHGHVVGSQLLKQVANVIKDSLRDEDSIYRYGGDEFVVILPGSNLENSEKVGERIIDLIKKTIFKFKNEITFKLSVSIGIAQFPIDASNEEEIIELADKMMYQAKETGRGKVCTTKEIFNKKN